VALAVKTRSKSLGSAPKKCSSCTRIASTRAPDIRDGVLSEWGFPYRLVWRSRAYDRISDRAYTVDPAWSRYMTSLSVGYSTSRTCSMLSLYRGPDSVSGFRARSMIDTQGAFLQQQMQGGTDINRINLRTRNDHVRAAQLFNHVYRCGGPASSPVAGRLMLEFLQRSPVRRQLGSYRASNGCTGRRIAAPERSLRARPSLVTLVYRRCESHRPVLQLSSPHSNSKEGRFAWAAMIDQGMNQSRV
jgi:hypothetical protein